MNNPNRCDIFVKHWIGVIHTSHNFVGLTWGMREHIGVPASHALTVHGFRIDIVDLCR